MSALVKVGEVVKADEQWHALKADSSAKEKEQTAINLGVGCGFGIVAALACFLLVGRFLFGPHRAGWLAEQIVMTRGEFLRITLAATLGATMCSSGAENLVKLIVAWRNARRPVPAIGNRDGEENRNGDR